MKPRPRFAALFLAATLSAQNFPEGRGKAEFVRICSACHPADVVTGLGNTKQGWRDLVNEMFLRGGSATARQKTAIVDYLAKTYPLPQARRSDKTK